MALEYWVLCACVSVWNYKFCLLNHDYAPFHRNTAYVCDGYLMHGENYTISLINPVNLTQS